MDGFTAVSERFKTKAVAEAVKRSCSVAIVQKAECKEKTEKPPALYDLTSLQREANRVLGYTAQQTLDYTQNLYEKKLVTYPRTDSRFLTEDMAHSLTDLVKLAFHTFPVEDVDNIPVHAEQVVNNKKVTDHHAIIPTRELQKCNLSELPKGELAILQLISNRLCVAVGDPHRYAETVIELDCGGTVFSTKGKTVVQDGWKALVQKNDSTKSDENVQTLPSVSVGDEMTVSGTEIKEGKTSPPKHFTEDTLLSAMETAGADEMPDEVERKGLGTPATRAGIIEKLVRIGFLERKGDKKTKSAMKQRCDGQRENTLSSLRPTSTNPTFTIISFIIRPRWMPHGNSKTSFFPVWRCKDSVIWFAWNTGCPLLHRSRIGSARKELFIPRSVPSVTNYVMRLMRC